MRKILCTVLAVLGLAAVLAAAPAQAVSTVSPALASNAMGALAVGCPTGDGPVSWGKAKVCPEGSGIRLHIQDSLTDGKCVRAAYWSNDDNAWEYFGPAACTTGQWITFYSADTHCDSNKRGPRLYKQGTGTYFKIPNTQCP